MYIITNKKNGILYIGVTSRLRQRIWEHKQKLVSGFSNKYNLFILIYFEVHESMYDAITREKQLKKWKRQWKLNLIGEFNPEWRDLYYDL